MDFSNERIIGKVIEISNDDILPNRFQPRKYFDEVETLELADSIKEHGILQPIVVRQVGDKYEIIAGERRFKANILAGNDSIPAIISNLDDKESSEIAVIENVQRQSLTPIEEAISYKRIIDMGYLTQEELARKVGKSQSAIANKIRLLKLSDNVQDALMSKKISERHARSLLKLDSLKKQDELLDRIIKERLTVRKTDEEISKMNNENINNNMSGVPFMGMNQPNNNSFGNISPITPIDNSSVEQINNENQDVEIPVSAVSPIMGTPLSDNQPVLASEPTSVSNFELPTDMPNSNPQPSFINLANDIPVSNIQSNDIYNNSNNQSISNPFGSNFNTDSNNVMSSINMNQNISNPIQNNDAPFVNQSNLNDFDTNNITPVEPIQSSIPSPMVNTPIDTQVSTPEPTISVATPFDTMNQPVDSVQPISLDMNSVIPNQVQDQPIPSPSLDSFNIPIGDPQPVNNPEVTNTIPSLDSSIFGTSVPISDEPIETPIPSFMPEQPIEGGEKPVVDLSTTIEPTPMNNDIPISNSIETPVQNTPEPIIVSNDDNQFDPIMPKTENTEPTLDFKTIINLIRQCSQTIEKCGYRIDTDEIDMGDKYQVTFTIDK